MRSMMVHGAFSEIDRLLQSNFLDQASGSFYEASIWAPRPRTTDFNLEVFEKDGQLVIRAGLAGCEPSDVSVSAEGRTLKICVDRKSLDINTAIGRSDSSMNSRDTKAVVNNGSVRQLERRIQIGRSYDVDTIAASLKNGLLTVSVKKAAMDEERKIPVVTS